MGRKRGGSGGTNHDSVAEYFPSPSSRTPATKGKERRLEKRTEEQEEGLFLHLSALIREGMEEMRRELRKKLIPPHATRSSQQGPSTAAQKQRTTSEDKRRK